VAAVVSLGVLGGGDGAVTGPGAGATVDGVAHARITGSEPADGAVVEQAPHEVALGVDAKPATVEGDPLQVYGPDGYRVDDGRISVGDEGRRIAVGLDPTRDRPAGRYEIVYRIVSADTHLIAGRLQFDTRFGVPAVAPADGSAGGGPAAGTGAGGVGRLLHGWPDEAWPPAVAGAALTLVAARIGWRRRRGLRRAAGTGPPLLPPMQGHLVATRADRTDHRREADRVHPG
jgi:copper transport protein